MKLLFFSGGEFESNIELDLELLKLTGKVYPSLTYIPACAYYGEKDFNEFVSHYEHYDFSFFNYFPVDEPFTSGMLDQALSSDIIYLSGGNTYYFLNYLRRGGMLDKLQAFVRRGGVLAGLSAGGIIMTPNINSAGFPSWDSDPNDVKITNLEAIGLVNFEFFPHFEDTLRYEKALLEYSQYLDIPLYAVPDGCGIVVEDHKISFIGEAHAFFGGYRFKV